MEPLETLVLVRVGVDVGSWDSVAVATGVGVCVGIGIAAGVAFILTQPAKDNRAIPRINVQQIGVFIQQIIMEPAVNPIPGDENLNCWYLQRFIWNLNSRDVSQYCCYHQMNSLVA